MMGSPHVRPRVGQSAAVAIAAVLFRLATAALNQPINTVADRKNGETRASDRPRRTTRIPLPC